MYLEGRERDRSRGRPRSSGVEHPNSEALRDPIFSSAIASARRELQSHGDVGLVAAVDVLATLPLHHSEGQAPVLLVFLTGKLQAGLSTECH